jgi:hypothetical protein
MKGQFRRAARSVATAVGASIALAVLGTSAARAEFVQCETPFLSSAPLESIVEGIAGTSINTNRVVWGSSLSVSALSTSGAGTVMFSLTDRMFAQPLSTLQLLVTDLNGLWQRYDNLAELASLNIDVDGPTKLFAAVFATSVDASTPGLYTLRANFAPVPLPAAVWLLMSALGGLALFRRKH